MEGIIMAQGNLLPAVPAVPVAAVKANGAPKQPTYQELLAKLAILEAAAKLAAQPGELTIRINDKVNETTGVQGKGGIAVYGLQRFPLSLYAEQWERLLTPEVTARILTACKDPRATRKAPKV